jgi:hypothetical protein
VLFIEPIWVPIVFAIFFPLALLSASLAVTTGASQHQPSMTSRPFTKSTGLFLFDRNRTPPSELRHYFPISPISTFW